MVMTAATASDEDLVRDCRSGSEGAFAELYRRYRQPVFATALRITRDFAEAQDATQEIFIRAYLSIADWDPRKSRFSTWLYRVAVNRAIDRLRATRRRTRKCSSLDDAGDAGVRARSTSGIMPSPYLELERKEQDRKIRRCIDMLPEHQKQLVLLRYCRGMKLNEIAEDQDRSLGTVKTTLYRAVKTMRARLNGKQTGS